MGHVGLTPQSATMLGGFKTQGKTAEAAERILDGAKELEDAGCCSVVLEAVPAPVAARITRELTVPTIGIGAGPDCDGQLLVTNDMIGLFDGPVPSFVKQYARVADTVKSAVESYVDDVKSGRYARPVAPKASTPTT
jgi:3-methyl-2-oxobutanoate hydroxymethyltransferase